MLGHINVVTESVIVLYVYETMAASIAPAKSHESIGLIVINAPTMTSLRHETTNEKSATERCMDELFASIFTFSIGGYRLYMFSRLNIGVSSHFWRHTVCKLRIYFGSLASPYFGMKNISIAEQTTNQTPILTPHIDLSPGTQNKLKVHLSLMCTAKNRCILFGIILCGINA
jgi:hypothetical protein